MKFALGENVTRSQGRFPNTRMGVEATIERAFEEAAAYRQQWTAYRTAKAGRNGRPAPPPRPAARGAGRNPRRLDQDPLPLLSAATRS